MNMKEIALICGLLTGGLGLSSALALMRASKVMPWDMQSYKGQSEPEKAFRTTAQWWNRIGLWCLLAAFVFSTAATAASYWS
jgi:hypothetical protein